MTIEKELIKDLRKDTKDIKETAKTYQRFLEKAGIKDIKLYALQLISEYQGSERVQRRAWRTVFGVSRKISFVYWSGEGLWAIAYTGKLTNAALEVMYDNY